MQMQMQMRCDVMTIINAVQRIGHVTSSQRDSGEGRGGTHLDLGHLGREGGQKRTPRGREAFCGL